MAYIMNCPSAGFLFQTTLLWMLFGVLASQAYTDEVCYGGNYLFGRSISEQILSSNRYQLVFKSQLGPSRIMYKDGKSLDPRLKVEGDHCSRTLFSCHSVLKIEGMTIDYVGTYSASFGSQTIRLMTLGVRDCATKKEVEYGRHYAIAPAGGGLGLQQIDYSPLFNDSNTVTLWRHSRVIRRVTVKDGEIVVDKFTPNDQGYYTIRGNFMNRGDYAQRHHVSIREVQLNHVFRPGQDYTITFPVEGIPFGLAYQHKDAAVPVTLLHSDSGYLANSGAFNGRIQLLGSGVKIRKLKAEDVGNFILRDSQGWLAKVVVLTNHYDVIEDVDEEEESHPLYRVLMGGLIFLGVAVAVATCPLWSKCLLYLGGLVIYIACCCWCCPAQDDEKEQEQNNDDYGEYPAPDQPPPFSRCRSAGDGDSTRDGVGGGVGVGDGVEDKTGDGVVVGYGGDFAFSMRPMTPALSTRPTTPAHVGPIPFQAFAAGGVEAPTIDLGMNCLNSDSGPRFEVPEGLTYPSAPPLSSDTPGSVYTSDKVNFL